MQKEIDFLKRIVKDANEISKEAFEVEQKGLESDLVTTLDLKIEKYLIDEINREYPDFDIVSEEFNNDGDITENCFIIDPIDGTINFANNLPLWGIQIACVKNGETVAAVISLPKLNEFYFADQSGAYLNDERISINNVPIKNVLYSIDGSNSLVATQRLRKYSPSRRSFGAVCVAMSFLASGRIHGAVYTRNKPWDYVPGLYICKMAGASICDKKGFHAAAMNDEFLSILEHESAKKQNVSKVFVLHSLNGDTLEYWGQNIKEEFEKKEVDVILPEFPIRGDFTYEKFKEGLEFYLDSGMLDETSIVVTHSISSSYFIRFCREFNYIPKAFVAVAPSLIYEYPVVRDDYFVQISKQAFIKDDSLEFVKNNIKNIYCLYSDEDNKNNEKYIKFMNDTGAEDMYLKYYNHFDGYHRIYKIPELNELIDKLL